MGELPVVLTAAVTASDGMPSTVTFLDDVGAFSVSLLAGRQRERGPCGGTAHGAPAAYRLADDPSRSPEVRS